MDRNNYGLALAVVLSPVGVVVIAVVVWLATELTKRPPLGARPTRRGFHSLAGAVGGFLVIAGWTLGLVAQMFWTAPFDVAWWGFAAPLAGAALTAAAYAVWAIRHPVLVEQPVIPVVRRTWTSFANRRRLRLLICSASALTALSVICGVASEPGVDGSANITFIGPSGGYSTTYGWTAGLPIVLMTTALIGLLWCALYLDAARPFTRVGSVDSDSRARTAAASTLLTVTLGAVLLTLGSVVIDLAYTATGSVGLQVPGSDPYMWSPGYSSLAPALTWVGWVPQVIGVLCLLRVIATPFGRRSDTSRRTPVVTQR